MRGNQPTIHDVARAAGVSKMTVSRVINRSPRILDDTRRRVEEAIGGLGYVPNTQARALAMGRNFLIALVHASRSAQTVLDVQQGMQEALGGTEFALVVRPLDRVSPTMLDDLSHFLERQRPYGVLLMPPVSENDEVAALCAEFGCRYVRMGSALLEDEAHSVASNDREAVRGATDHLLALGHRRIALVAGPPDFLSARERRLGFEEALATAGVPLLPSMVVEGDYSFASGMAAADRLLDAPCPPTAIFASNDDMAAGVMQSARQRGLDLPGALSVIGFDDLPVAGYLWPPLTTVRRPIAAMASAAARRLVEPVRGIGDMVGAFDPTFESVLVRRGSVAAIGVPDAPE